MDDRLIVLRQRVPLVEIDDQVRLRAAFPPARIVVIFRDLVGSRASRRHRARPIRRRRSCLSRATDRCRRRASCCGTTPSLARMRPAKPPTRNFRPFMSSTRLDLLAEPAAHLAAWCCRSGCPRQLKPFKKSLSSSMPPPKNCQAFCWRRVEAERKRRAEGEGRVLAEIIIETRCGTSRRCRSAPRRAPAGRARFRRPRRPGSGICCR